MSLSPLTVVKETEVPDYINAIIKFGQLLRFGRSFSGHERNCVYLNTGKQKFANVSHVTGLALDDDGRSICAVDWDHDGDLDFWLANRTAPRLRLMRNELKGSRHLAFLLEGKTCNRNAIGARVSVQLHDDNERRLMRTVRAGSSFLSQSSRWLHFGVGQADRVAKVTVQWPDGSVDVLTDLQTGVNYHLVQGQAATTWSRPQPATALKPSAPVLPKATDSAHVFLASRMPMIHIPINSFDGRTILVGGPSLQPTLINLWASWCSPCVAELKEFSAKQQALEASGLRIIAASVDGIDPNHDTTASDARQMVDKLGITFETGMIDKDTAERLEFYQSWQFIRNVPMPVPTSFLIDRHGQLAAVYRGPLEIDQLIKDVKVLDTREIELRTLAAPLPGQWLVHPLQIDVSAKILTLQERGLVADAVNMFMDYTRLVVKGTGRPPDSEGYGQVLNNMGILMRDAGQTAQAEKLFRQSIKLLPDEVQPHSHLADLLQQAKRLPETLPLLTKLAQLEPAQSKWELAIAMIYEKIGQPQQAVAHHQSALKIEPGLAASHNFLGTYHGSIGDHKLALQQFRLAVAHGPDVHIHQYNLGSALVITNQFVDAAKHLEKSLKLKPQSPRAVYQLARLIATHQDKDLPPASRAVELAEELVKKVTPRQAMPYDVLGMAYARDGQFEKAIQAANQAHQLASSAGQTRLAGEITQRIQSYRANKPYLEKPLPAK